MNQSPASLNFPHWVSEDKFATLPLAPHHLDNLLNPGSLTYHLRDITKKSIEHRLKFAGWAHPNIEECQALGISPNNQCWIREIEWIHHHSTWIFARVIFPEQTAMADNGFFTKIGKKSLGDFLFKSNELERSPFEICCIPYNHPYCQISSANNRRSYSALWARRSIIRFHNNPLLIIEIFKPDYFRFFEK